MQPNDDGSTASLPLPFQFSLYGDMYSSVFINNNGNISFQQSYSSFSAAGFPSPNFRMVAPFWGDVDTRGNGGQVWYKITPTAMYVNWVEVGYFSQQTDKLNTFQVIITNGQDPVLGIGNNVAFCYLDMQWTTGSASQGSNGFGGVPATVGANAGDGVLHTQIGRFNRDSTNFEGPYSVALSSGVHWLDSTRFEVSALTDTVPPIFGTGSSCDTLFVVIGEESWFSIPVLSGGQGWTITCTSEAPSLGGYMQEPALPGDWVNVDFSVLATPDDIGVHTVTFSAVYVTGPNMTSTYDLVVVVQDFSTAVEESTAMEAIRLMPNPTNGHVVLDLPEAMLAERILLHDAQGRQVMSLPLAAGLSRWDLDVSGLGNGCYILTVFGDQWQLSERLVVSPR